MINKTFKTEIKLPEDELKLGANVFFAETMLTLSSLPFDSMSEGVAHSVIAICACTGKVITTGLGKNGYVAEKIASLFSSLGTPSCYLHPAQASHGDVGIVVSSDILMVFSTSGKTREVIETINLSRALGISKVISVTSHLDAPIRDMSDIVIDIGIIKEAGYLALAPTTSIMTMLLAADAVVVGCAKAKNLTRGDYGLRHHGGYLGSVARGDGIIK